MKKIFAVLVLLLTFSVGVRAENALKAGVFDNAEVIKVDFSQILKMALDNNNKLQAYKYDVASAQNNIGMQRGNFLPRVSLNENFIWTDNPGEVFGLKLNQGKVTTADFAGAPTTFNNPDSLTNFNSDISLEQSVFNKGNSVRLKIAKYQYNEAEYQLLRTKEQVILETIKAYLNVQNAKTLVDVAEKSIESAKEHNRMAQVRYENELGLYSDVLRTNTFLKKAEQKYVSALKNYEVAMRSLGLAVGTTSSIDPSSDVPELIITSYVVYSHKVKDRSDIKAMEISLQNAENALNLQKTMYFPEIVAGGNYQLYSEDYPFGADGNNFRMYGMIRWNMFSGFQRRNAVKIAENDLEKAKEALEESKNKAQFEVFEAYQTVNEKRKNLELAESALKSAQEGMKLVEVRYKNSFSPIIDVLDAQLNLNQSSADMASSRNEYLLSLINLSFVSGTLLEDLGLSQQEL